MDENVLWNVLRAAEYTSMADENENCDDSQLYWDKACQSKIIYTRSDKYQRKNDEAEKKIGILVIITISMERSVSIYALGIYRNNNLNVNKDGYLILYNTHIVIKSYTKVQ